VAAQIEDELVISADSHVVEEPTLWSERLGPNWRDRAPVFPQRSVGQQFQGHPGGFDPHARVDEMRLDGVSAEVLYPSLAMNLFGLDDAALQAACFRVYNDWIIDFCKVAPRRVFGIAMLSGYDIAGAVAELERCRNSGLVGAMLWEVPPVELGFATDHYDALWAAAQALEMPISVHSLTGVPYTWPRKGIPFTASPVAGARHANEIIFETANFIADVIGSGALERFPGLRLVIVESEASWMPAFLARHDHYYRRAEHREHLTMLPSEYFARQFSVTFFNDPMIGPLLPHWGTANCMWSSDYPHPNSSWPESRAIIERDLGHLDAPVRRHVLSQNVCALYNLHLGAAR
jgi:predicted TIM-barrel fold metal-dependent hydrolase